MMGHYLSNYNQTTISIDDFAQGLDLLFNPKDELELKKKAF
jgi:hypothetical protein